MPSHELLQPTKSYINLRTSRAWTEWYLKEFDLLHEFSLEMMPKSPEGDPRAAALRAAWQDWVDRATPFLHLLRERGGFDGLVLTLGRHIAIGRDQANTDPVEMRRRYQGHWDDNPLEPERVEELLRELGVQDRGGRSGANRQAVDVAAQLTEGVPDTGNVVSRSRFAFFCHG